MANGQRAGESGASASGGSKQGGRSRGGASGGGSRGSRASRLASEAASQIGEVAQEAGTQAREAVSSITALANEQVRRLADQQVSVGADLVAHIAEAVRAAADTLDENVPQLSDTARGAAERIEGISETIRDQSAAELFQYAADVARRRPALLFGVTALTGFVLFRLLNTARDEDYDGDDEYEDWDDELDEWQGEDELGENEVFAADAPMTPGQGSGDRSYGG